MTNGLTIRENTFTAAEYIELWESVWSGAPAFEQVEKALANSVYRVGIYDGDKIAAMARMIGDLGLCYYIKDVIVRPEYQAHGVGRMMLNSLLTFIRENGVPGTDIAVELCAMPDKMPFYGKFGFATNEAQRMRLMLRAGETA